MSIRTVEQLVDTLSAEISWRRKELTDLRYVLESSVDSRTRRATLTRAALALLYAHWEGYVKAAAERYLEFVCMQRRKNSELSDSLLALTVRSSLQAAESQGTLPSIRPNARSRIRISAQGFLSATVSLYGCLRTFYE